MFPHAKTAIPAAVLAACLGIGLAPLAAGAGTPSVPVYPGAVAAAHPAGLGLKKAPPPQAKTYVTNDGFAKVKAWYHGPLKGAQEIQQSGMEKYEDAFLVGSVDSGAVVMVESYQGKTWIVIGPPV